jgi:hypothetical protein
MITLNPGSGKTVIMWVAALLGQHRNSKYGTAIDNRRGIGIITVPLATIADQQVEQLTGKATSLHAHSTLYEDHYSASHLLYAMCSCRCISSRVAIMYRQERSERGDKAESAAWHLPHYLHATRGEPDTGDGEVCREQQELHHLHCC